MYDLALNDRSHDFNPYTVRLDLDADRLADNVKNSVEREDGRVAQSNIKLPKYFCLPNLGLITEPTTILDRFGRVLVWYLPGIMSGRMVSYI
jgi:hypothetical protein